MIIQHDYGFLLDHSIINESDYKFVEYLIRLLSLQIVTPAGSDYLWAIRKGG